jgi:hypothetical protein
MQGTVLTVPFLMRFEPVFVGVKTKISLIDKMAAERYTENIKSHL